jgi:hypothetical protein
MRTQLSFTGFSIDENKKHGGIFLTLGDIYERDLLTFTIHDLRNPI